MYGTLSSASKYANEVSIFACRRFMNSLKFGKIQADNLAAVFNRSILDFGTDFFLYFIGV